MTVAPALEFAPLLVVFVGLVVAVVVVVLGAGHQGAGFDVVVLQPVAASAALVVGGGPVPVVDVLVVDVVVVAGGLVCVVVAGGGVVAVLVCPAGVVAVVAQVVEPAPTAELPEMPTRSATQSPATAAASHFVDVSILSLSTASLRISGYRLT